MNPEDKKEIINLFNQGFQEVVLPYMGGIHEEISGIHAEISGIHAEITGIKDTLDDHGYRLDRIERKLNAVVDRQDSQEVEIKELRDKIG